MSSDPTKFPPPPGPVRRVITAHDGQGRSTQTVELLQTQAAEGFPALRSAGIFTTDKVPARETLSGEDTANREVKGPLGLIVSNGTNFRFTDIAPGGFAPMHRTASIDYNILIFGTLEHETADGTKTLLKPGDVVVQRGTLHSWRNPSDTEWARWTTVLVDAEPVVLDGQPLDSKWQL